MTDKFTRIVQDVIKDSDIIIEVLDARNPLGTRSKRLESIINRSESKYLVLLLNKADLVPKKIIYKWTDYLSKEYPTFYSSDKFGYQKSIRFLKNKLSKMIKTRPIRICLFGYPNVGKSSIINALRGKKVAPTSPLAGFTQGKKYIKISSEDIYLIDTPGIIPFSHESEVELVIKGAIRPDKIVNLMDSVDKIISIVGKDELIKKYNIDFQTTNEFLELLAKKMGKLLPKGIPDVQTVAKILINDFQRGKIYYYIKPPSDNLV
ncbi:MAG: GTPase [Candidatus Helarchaeota archaeon]